MSTHDNTAWKQNLYRAIGREVQRKRTAAKLTVAYVAQRLGYSKQMIGRVEEGDNAPVHFLAAFAQLVGCPVAELIPGVPATFATIIEKAS